MTEAQTDPNTEAAVEPVVEHRPYEDVLRDLEYHLDDESIPEEERRQKRQQLRKNRSVYGIAGQMAQDISKNQQQVDAQAAQAKAAEEALQRQLKLADEDPEAFAAQFTEETRAKLAQRDIRQIAYNERQELASHLGHAFDDLPDGKMSDDQVAELTRKLAGVPEAQVVAVYAATRTDFIARNRAERIAEEKRPEWLRSEREAWEAEEAAKRVRATPAPNVRVGRAAGRDTDEPPFPSPEWERWYEKTILKGR